jgi:hypothetical protein
VKKFQKHCCPCPLFVIVFRSFCLAEERAVAMQADMTGCQD